MIKTKFEKKLDEALKNMKVSVGISEHFREFLPKYRKHYNKDGTVTESVYLKDEDVYISMYMCMSFVYGSELANEFDEFITELYKKITGNDNYFNCGLQYVIKDVDHVDTDSAVAMSFKMRYKIMRWCIDQNPLVVPKKAPRGLKMSDTKAWEQVKAYCADKPHMLKAAMLDMQNQWKLCPWRKNSPLSGAFVWRNTKLGVVFYTQALGGKS